MGGIIFVFIYLTCVSGTKQKRLTERERQLRLSLAESSKFPLPTVLKLDSLLEDSCLVHSEHLLVKRIHGRQILAQPSCRKIAPLCLHKLLYGDENCSLVVARRWKVVSIYFSYEWWVIVMCHFIAGWCECFTTVNFNYRVGQCVSLIEYFYWARKGLYDRWYACVTRLRSHQSMIIIKGHALIHVVKASIILSYKSGMSGRENKSACCISWHPKEQLITFYLVLFQLNTANCKANNR